VTILETERLLLRDWTRDDVAPMRALATDPRVLQYIGNQQPWSEERIQRFVLGGIERSKTRGWILWPVIHKRDERFIGFCGFNDGFPPDPEIGWWLFPDYWGQGLATEAARAVLAYGLETWNFPRVISIAQPANRASIRVMEKLGMTLNARFIKDGIELLRYAINA
jgi:[ribosomal protein S5]-alanine N-acetyltransferase